MYPLVVKRILLTLAALLCFLWAAQWTALPLRSNSERTPRTIRPGVVYRVITDPTGPWIIHILEIDLRRPELALATAVAYDVLPWRERVSSMAARRNLPRGSVVGAVNGDYFNPLTGEVQNNQISGGEFVKAFVSSGPRPDDLDIPNSQFAVTADGRLVIDQFTFAGTALWPDGAVTRLEGVNIVPRRGGMTLFNRFIGSRSPLVLTADSALQLPLMFLGRTGDTLICRSAERAASRGGFPLDGRRYVLAGYRSGRIASMRNAPEGDTVRIVLSVVPRRGVIAELIGGWPRLVRDGRSMVAPETLPRNTDPAALAPRHPRTGVGISRDGGTAYLIAVDGRQESSAGMSLSEFADLMLSLGVSQGLNLDGGGSTTMVIGGEVVNSPSAMPCS